MVAQIVLVYAENALRTARAANVAGLFSAVLDIRHSGRPNQFSGEEKDWRNRKFQVAKILYPG